MTKLICKVQRLFLKESERPPIKEGEVFEVDEKTAEQYVLGGIAKPFSAEETRAKPQPEIPPEETEKTDTGKKKR